MTKLTTEKIEVSCTPVPGKGLKVWAKKGTDRARWHTISYSHWDDLWELSQGYVA